MAQTASSAMKDKWRYRVCLDLYAGCGVNLIQERNKLWWGTAPLSLKIAYPFDTYVFCEEDSKCATALTERLADPDWFGLDPLTLDLGSETLGEDIRRIKGADEGRGTMKVVVITGDANDAARYVRYLLPAWEGKRYVLTMLDPQSADFRWESMEMLTAGEKMDLFFLFPEDFDIERNARREAKLPPGAARLDSYYPDTRGWRDVALDPSLRHLGPSLRRIYKRDMWRLLDYRWFGARDIRVRNRVGDIYTLLFASKHETGKMLWDRVNRPEHDQDEFFLDDLD